MRGIADRSILPAQLAAALAALACVGAALFIAAHHPLSPQVVLPVVLLWSAAAFLRPAAWLFVVPALLPVVDLAPWTGWLIAEEFDLVVLGAAAGGYASIALRGTPPGAGAARLSGAAAVIVALYAISTFVGLWRGIALAATAEFGWFEGYYSAPNSLRIAKGFGLALLMLPLLCFEWRRSSTRTTALFASGLAAGLGAAALIVLWERAAFPGVLNFSSDYRATGSFWEMHVGGASLDGFLVLTIPFAIWQFMVESRRVRWALAGGLILLAGYACLATFSRGVYLAVPVSLAILAVLLLRRNDALAPREAARLFAKACALVAVTAAAAFVVFRTGGYRSQLAVLGVLALTLPMGPIARALVRRDLIAASLGGLAVGAAGAIVAPFVAKGPYLIYALAFGATAASILRCRRTSGDRKSAIVAAGGYAALVVAAAAVTRRWGGAVALIDSALALALLALLLAHYVRARTPPWPDALPAQGVIVGVAALLCAVTAVFGGGAYMTGRITSSERDLDERIVHWRHVVRLLDTPAERFLGRGLGRFPQSYLFGVPGGDFPGSYRTATNEGKRFLALSGPTHDVGAGELLRVGQRVRAAGAGPYTVVLDARATADAKLYVELCERHLLYAFACGSAAVTVKGAGRAWQRSVVSLDGARLSGGPWYAPRLAFFALSVDTPDRVIEIDNVSLLGPGGGNLLANGDFADGLARWFPTSDRFHLPWHAKNIALAVLFDQGLVGLLLLASLVGGALWRLVFGRAREHALAPFLAAALTGFLVVGMFDSLIDAPRLAFLFFLLVLAGLSLPERGRAAMPGTVTV